MADQSTDPYFGYTSTDNQDLKELRKWSRIEREDLTRYNDTDPTGLPPYNPTVNWSDGKYSDHGRDLKDEFVKQAAMNDTIEKIWKRIHTQVPEQIEALQEQWFKVSMVIQGIKDDIAKAAVALAGHWDSAAAKVFLQRGPGASIKSLDDWYSSAIANSLGLIYLVATVREYRAKIDDLFDRYKRDMVVASTTWVQDVLDERSRQYNLADGSQDNSYPYDPIAEDKDGYLVAMRDHAEDWHRQARDLQYQMSQGYWDVIREHFGGGHSGIYEGPHNAVIADPMLLLPDMPNMPHTPNVNVTPPTLTPPQLDLSNKPQLTPPDLPGGPPALTAPDLRLTREAPQVAVPAVDAPAVDAPAVDPSLVDMANGLLTARGMAGQAPGLPTGLTGTAGAPGTGNLPQSGLGMPPAAPKLRKGTLGRSATPPGQQAGRSPGAPNNALRRKGTAGPDENQLLPPGELEEFSRPSGLSSSPPVLRGRSGTSRPPASYPEQTGRPGAVQPPGATPPVLNRKRQSGTGQVAPGTPGGPVGDEFRRPAQPGASAPVLRGSRLTPIGSEELERPAGTVRGAVRRPGAGEPEMASRHKNLDKREQDKARIDREYEKIRKLLSEDEAWTVPTPGGAVLDNAVPQRPARLAEPRPVLGGGATG